MELAGYDWEPHYVDFFNGEARSPEYQALNEMAEAPVFVEGDLTLSQSCVIQLHVAEKTGKFLADDRQEMMRWLFWDAQKGTGQQGSLRFLMNFLPEDKRPQPVIDFMQGRLKAAYKVLDTHLNGRDWIVGDGDDVTRTAAEEGGMMVRVRGGRILEVEPKASLDAREPDEHGRPVPLARYVDGLEPLAPRCPRHERVELAVEIEPPRLDSGHIDPGAAQADRRSGRQFGEQIGRRR